MNTFRVIDLETLRSRVPHDARIAWPDHVSIVIEGNKKHLAEAELNGTSYEFYLDHVCRDMFDDDQFQKEANFEAWTPGFDGARENLILTRILLSPYFPKFPSTVLSKVVA